MEQCAQLQRTVILFSSVQVLSAGVGKGSSFTVRLPVMPEAADAAPATEAAPDREGSHRHILVVDDNVDAAEILSSMLELDGHHVQTCFTGAAALEAARQALPEVVILDIGLPDRTGHDLAARLRELPGMEKAILIALTGYGQMQDKERAVEAGFNHHLTKPVAFDRLIQTIHDLSAKFASISSLK